MCLEELIPSNHSKSYIYSILIRTALVVSTLIVGLSVPFFGKSLSLSFFIYLFVSIPRELSSILSLSVGNYMDHRKEEAGKRVLDTEILKKIYSSETSSRNPIF